MTQIQANLVFPAPPDLKFPRLMLLDIQNKMVLQKNCNVNEPNDDLKSAECRLRRRERPLCLLFNRSELLAGRFYNLKSCPFAWSNLKW